VHSSCLRGATSRSASDQGDRRPRRQADAVTEAPEEAPPPSRGKPGGSLGVSGSRLPAEWRSRNPHTLRPGRERGARVRALARLRALPSRAGGLGGRELLDRDPPAQRHGRSCTGSRAQRAIQDTLIRYARMRGKADEVDPRTDHAGIATDAVERLLCAGHEPRTERLAWRLSGGRSRRGGAEVHFVRCRACARNGSACPGSRR